MGLNDRDYMREQHRKRRVLGSTRWNDSKSRVEIDRLDSTGIRGQYFQKCSSLTFHRSKGQAAIFAVALMGTAIPAYQSAKRVGWIPDFKEAEPFPESGSVTVANGTTKRKISCWLTVTAADANALVQLYDAKGERHVLTVYVGKNSRVRLLVPAGTYQIRLIEGQKWHGPERFFGSNTAYETIAELMVFTPQSAHILDLHRRPNGNLKTRMVLTNPDKL